MNRAEWSRSLRAMSQLVIGSITNIPSNIKAMVGESKGHDCQGIRGT